MRRGTPVGAGILVLCAGALATCSAPSEAPPARLDLPFRVEEAGPLVRRDLEQRLAAARAAFADPALGDAGKASAAGDYALSLFSHGFFAEAAAACEAAAALAPDQDRWPYLEAHAQRRQGEMAAAARLFAAAEERGGDPLPATLWRAEMLVQLGRWEEAEGAARRVLELAPDCAQAMAALCRIALARGDAEAAVAHCSRALEHPPEVPSARYHLALAYRRLGREREAEEHSRRLSGENYSAVVTCFADPVMIEARRRQLAASTYDQRASRAYEEGDLVEALAELRQADATDARRAPVRYDIAALLLRLGRPQEARRELDQLLARMPRHALAHVLRGQIEAVDGRLDEAEARYREALALDPALEEGHYQLGDLLRRTGRCAEALAEFDATLRHAPDTVAAVLRKALCLRDLGRRDEAQEVLAAARHGFPWRDEPSVLTARLALEAGGPEAEEIATDLSGVLARRPVAAVGEALAIALAGGGRWQEAADVQARVVAALERGAGRDARVELARTRLAAYEAGRLPPLRIPEAEIDVLSDLTTDVALAESPRR